MKTGYHAGKTAGTYTRYYGYTQNSGVGVG